jgi:hypothetical protein
MSVARPSKAGLSEQVRGDDGRASRDEAALSHRARLKHSIPLAPNSIPVAALQLLANRRNLRMDRSGNFGLASYCPGCWCPRLEPEKPAHLKRPRTVVCCRLGPAPKEAPDRPAARPKSSGSAHTGVCQLRSSPKQAAESNQGLRTSDIFPRAFAGKRVKFIS